MVLKCIVVSPDRNVTGQLLEMFRELGGINVVRQLDQYPHEHELLRVLRSLAPPILFLGLSDPGRCFEIIATVQAEFPGLQIACFHRAIEPQLLLKLMQHGIREYMASPFDVDGLAEVMIRLRDAAMKSPVISPRSNLVYSFLPSKPGSGTTTIALNASIAISRQPKTRVLLADMDLNSGLVRFLLKLNNEYTILDAARHSTEMDETLGPLLVCANGQLDVLITGKITTGVRLEPSNVRSLIDYTRKNYQAIMVDLSGNMEKYALEVMQESRKVFLVVTPEIPSLHLAREKVAFLKDQGLQDKVAYILNRHAKSDLLQLEQIRSLLDGDIYFTFCNDYRGVGQSVAEGREVNRNSELGRQFNLFANNLLNREAPAGTVKKSSKKELKGIRNFLKFGVSRLAPASASETKT
ncbi:MAG: CpaE family protein [Acidobacteriota bacterium]